MNTFCNTICCISVQLNTQYLIQFSLILQWETKSIVQAHNVCTTQVDKNRRYRTFYNGVGGRTTGLKLLPFSEYMTSQKEAAPFEPQRPNFRPNVAGVYSPEVSKPAIHPKG